MSKAIDPKIEDVQEHVGEHGPEKRLGVGFNYSYAPQTDGTPEQNVEFAQTTFEIVRLSLIEDLTGSGIATLINEQGSAHLVRLPPIKAVLLPVKHLKKPILMVPAAEGYKLLQTLTEEGESLLLKDLNWEDYV